MPQALMREDMMTRITLRIPDLELPLTLDTQHPPSSSGLGVLVLVPMPVAAWHAPAWSGHRCDDICTRGSIHAKRLCPGRFPRRAGSIKAHDLRFTIA